MTHIELLQKLGLAQREVANLKVDVNLKDTRIRELEKQLRAARAEVRGYETGTQTMRKLEILGDSNDNDGSNPYNTGKFDSNRAWSKVR